MPASVASLTMYSMDGLSTTGSISLGTDFVIGRKRVPRPAEGTTAWITVCFLSAIPARVANMGAKVDTITAKQELRSQIRATRLTRRRAGADIPGSLETERAGMVRSFDEAWARLGGPRLPALFLPLPTEPDLTWVVEAAPECLLPVVAIAGVPIEDPEWGLHRAGEALAAPSQWHPSDGSHPRRLAGPEGIARADVVVIPALAVDESGTRLGQGGGWYDRTLPHRRDGVPVLACVFDDEVREAGALPREAHDVRVDGVITPSMFRLFDAV